jgi:hypothetical protein
MDMVTGIWDAAVVAIIADGAEAVVIATDGHAADTADGVNCYNEAASITKRPHSFLRAFSTMLKPSQC